MWKRSEGGLLGSAWKRRWCVLESRSLRVFESFDVPTSRTKNLKDVIDLDSSWKVRCVTTESRDFAFILTHDDHSSWYMSAENQFELDLWLSELNIIILSSSPVAFDINAKSGWYQLLDIAKDLQRPKPKPLTTDSLKNAFYAAVKSVQNKAKSNMKSQDVKDKFSMNEQINLLKRAYYAVYRKHFLMQAPVFRHQKYECNLTKSNDMPSKLGLTLAESPSTGWVVISSIADDVQVSGFTDPAIGRLRIKDAIYSIDGEVVGGDAGLAWTLSRVVQRLNAVRVPPGSSVQIVFCRPISDAIEVTPHLAENLSDDYIVSMELTDPVSVAKDAKQSRERRGSLFSWSAAAAAADTSENVNKSSGPEQEAELVAQKSEGSRKTLLQRARASLSWANSAALTESMAAAATDSAENPSTNTVPAAHSHHNVRSHGVSSEDELHRLQQVNAALESRADMLRKKAESAEDSARKIALELADAREDLSAAQLSEQRLLEELTLLKKQLLVSNVHISNRSLPLSASGMHEKMARLHARYDLPHEEARPELSQR